MKGRVLALVASAGGAPALVFVLALGVLSPPASALTQGGLVGAIKFAGGPVSTGTRPSVAGRVSVFDSAGRKVASQYVRAKHKFHFSLAPGRYELNAGRRLYLKDNCPPKTAFVHRGQTTHVDVETGCNIP